MRVGEGDVTFGNERQRWTDQIGHSFHRKRCMGLCAYLAATIHNNEQPLQPHEISQDRSVLSPADGRRRLVSPRFCVAIAYLLCFAAVRL